MKIIIPKTKPASVTSLAKLEELVGKKLPNSYLNFARDHNGARPAANVFKIGENNHAGVDEFISADESIRIPHVVDGFPPFALAVARASGGNFVYLDPKTFAAYFWDHEVEAGDIKLADSFDEFLTKLEPSDANQVKLKPGQVKRIWGNPDFKPEF
jgi:hypothetical protein